MEDKVVELVGGGSDPAACAAGLFIYADLFQNLNCLIYLHILSTLKPWNCWSWIKQVIGTRLKLYKQLLKKSREKQMYLFSLVVTMGEDKGKEELKDGAQGVI